eukprot:c18111_g1_i3.p1 GENE.c18111_g1_i3~~c18111_g1_i3.p1  ORF type:complete len:107 (-),score=18.08 c18111_g1_i3:56-376(-)
MAGESAVCGPGAVAVCFEQENKIPNQTQFTPPTSEKRAHFVLYVYWEYACVFIHSAMQKKALCFVRYSNERAQSEYTNNDNPIMCVCVCWSKKSPSFSRFVLFTSK